MSPQSVADYMLANNNTPMYPDLQAGLGDRPGPSSLARQPLRPVDPWDQETMNTEVWTESSSVSPVPSAPPAMDLTEFDPYHSPHIIGMTRGLSSELFRYTQNTHSCIGTSCFSV